MIEPNLSGLSVSKQCALLSISRSSFYYEPKGEPERNLDLMLLISIYRCGHRVFSLSSWFAHIAQANEGHS